MFHALRLTGVCHVTIAKALVRLKLLVLLDWQRRCGAYTDGRGRYALKQLTNTYRIIADPGAGLASSCPITALRCPILLV